MHSSTHTQQTCIVIECSRDLSVRLYDLYEHKHSVSPSLCFPDRLWRLLRSASGSPRWHAKSLPSRVLLSHQRSRRSRFPFFALFVFICFHFFPKSTWFLPKRSCESTRSTTSSTSLSTSSSTSSHHHLHHQHLHCHNHPAHI